MKKEGGQKSEKGRKRGGERETVRDAVTRRPSELPPELPPALRKPLKKKTTTYTPLSDLRRSLPPPFAPSRAQEFPTLPPKPLKVLPKPEEDKKLFSTVELLKQSACTKCRACSLEKTPSGGDLTQARTSKGI